jgi:hypothetical protein
MKIRHRNWLNETRRQETDRLLNALAESVQTAHTRINGLEYRVNLLASQVAPIEAKPESDDEN